MNPIIVLTLLSITIETSRSAKILFVCPTPSISHQYVFHSVCNELLERGHELVFITTDASPQSHPNLTQIEIHDTSYEIWQNAVKNNLDFKKITTSPMIETNIFLHNLMYEIFEAQLNDTRVKSLLENQNVHFDLVMVENWFRPTLVFGKIFNASVVSVSSFSSLSDTYNSISMPAGHMYSDMATIIPAEDKTFTERVEDWYSELLFKYYYWKFEQKDNAILRKYLGDNAPGIKTLQNEIDLLLLNVSPLWFGARPVPPNVVYYGGGHVRPPRALPKELNQMLNNATEGIVYMSLGSNIHSSQLSEKVLKTFIDTFKQLPYQVLWKFEADALPVGLVNPPNVKLAKWLPQADLLHHPNIVAFVTQAGLQSTDEAINAGVPLVGLPFWSDQHANANMYQIHGIGRALKVKKMTSKDLKDVIIDVATRERYRLNLKKLKSIINDQPEPPLKRLGWWIDHIIRHGGGSHLRAPNFSVAKIYGLDVFTAIIGLMLLAILVLRYIVKTFHQFPSEKVKVF